MAIASERPRDRLAERALSRLRQARSAHGVVVLLVGALVLARVVVFCLQQAFVLTGDVDAQRVVQLVSGIISTLVDVVVLVVVLLLLEAHRRIERESDRIQSFMDNVYRRRI